MISTLLHAFAIFFAPTLFRVLSPSDVIREQTVRAPRDTPHDKPAEILRVVLTTKPSVLQPDTTQVISRFHAVQQDGNNTPFLQHAARTQAKQRVSHAQIAQSSVTPANTSQSANKQETASLRPTTSPKQLEDAPPQVRSPEPSSQSHSQKPLPTPPAVKASNALSFLASVSSVPKAVLPLQSRPPAQSLSTIESGDYAQTAAKSSPLGAYIAAVNQQIRARWLTATLPAGLAIRGRPIDAEISFTIRRSGRVENLMLTRSSGHYGLDNIALGSIPSATVKIPRGLHRRQLEHHVILRLRPQKGHHKP